MEALRQTRSCTTWARSRPRRDPCEAAALLRSERAFMQRHTIIGEPMISAAPALGAVARLVRATHERDDGNGYRTVWEKGTADRPHCRCLRRLPRNDHEARVSPGA